LKEILSHDRQQETAEAKALWFQSLSVQERMEMLDAFTDLILELNPEVAERKHAEPSKGSILIVSKI
jgi:hypothetical protein